LTPKQGFPNFLTQNQVFKTQKQVFLTQKQVFFKLKIRTIFAKFLRVRKVQVFPKKIPNFKNRTFPKLAKMKSSEISVKRRALRKSLVDLALWFRDISNTEKQ